MCLVLFCLLSLKTENVNVLKGLFEMKKSVYAKKAFTTLVKAVLFWTVRSATRLVSLVQEERNTIVCPVWIIQFYWNQESVFFVISLVKLAKGVFKMIV